MIGAYEYMSGDKPFGILLLIALLCACYILAPLLYNPDDDDGN